MAFFRSPESTSRSNELTRRLAEVIEAYRREHPDVSRWEIRCAVRRVLRGTNKQFAVFGMAAGALALLGVFAAYYGQSSRDGSAQFPVVPFLIFLALLVGWVFLVRLRE